MKRKTVLNLATLWSGGRDSVFNPQILAVCNQRIMSTDQIPVSNSEVVKRILMVENECYWSKINLPPDRDKKERAMHQNWLQR